jgi:hypothetical protein
MTKDEATALVAALDQEFSRPSVDAWTLRRRKDIEGYAAAARPDGSWDVVLLWLQREHRFGIRVATLKDVEAATAEEAAVALRLYYVEEPHEALDEADGDGRNWFGRESS